MWAIQMGDVMTMKSIKRDLSIRDSGVETLQPSIRRNTGSTRGDRRGTGSIRDLGDSEVARIQECIEEKQNNNALKDEIDQLQKTINRQKNMLAKYGIHMKTEGESSEEDTEQSSESNSSSKKRPKSTLTKMKLAQNKRDSIATKRDSIMTNTEDELVVQSMNDTTSSKLWGKITKKSSSKALRRSVVLSQVIENGKNNEGIEENEDSDEEDSLMDV
eukprot:CAMPEP_0168516348 /NCGR_PEP_ID=MMETSP0405-20121227/5348_1 /TAXON_ID=498012 /ORGANISM="Trichosphaerium sp, Strain Am-I-7 wt" /LENGTH=216 /DNA_ID=CAMNT_0008536041 /DNA_START=139 /DNA_END=789 /DNA_ORIENTATION=-